MTGSAPSRTRLADGEPGGAPPLRALGDSLDALRSGLDACGALGLLLVESASLAGVERAFGQGAHRQVTGRLAARVRELLADRLREGDRVLLGELGRDELLVLLFRRREERGFYREGLAALAEELGASLARASARIGYPFAREPLGFRVGAALAFDDPTLRPERILAHARERAAEDAELRARLAAHRRRERFLDLLLGERLTCCFEPIVHLASGRRLGYEALARGLPDGEFPSPRELFGAAREAGLVFELDCLCRRTALREAKALPGGAKLFLNCLPSAIHDPAFEGERLRRTLQGTGLAPRDVVLEISERESIENFAIFREVCDHYAGLGFGIALDDVGAGYSSLEAITELAPDFIKADLAFVRGIDADPARREVLVALASVARRIGAVVIAEGVETSEQRATLQSLGIPYGQGHLLTRDEAALRCG